LNLLFQCDCGSLVGVFKPESSPALAIIEQQISYLVKKQAHESLAAPVSYGQPGGVRSKQTDHRMTTLMASFTD